MVKISERYKGHPVVKTGQYKFPLDASVLYGFKNLKFQVIFLSKDGQRFETPWLWNFEGFNEKNQRVIDRQIEDAEEAVHLALKRSINNDLRQVRRRQMAEAKIERLFDKI